jgi:hypothetical protein
MKKIYACLLLAMSCMSLMAQTNPTPQSLPYTQDFAALTPTITAYPVGWQGWVVATTFPALNSPFPTAAPQSDRTLTASGTPGSNGGNVYNYDSRIGFLNNGSLDLSLILALNTTGQTGVQVVYDIMTIRNPHDGGANTRINEVTLQYRVGTTGAFTTLTGIEYQNNTTTLTSGAVVPQNVQNKSIALPSACDNQAVVQVRWMSRQVSGGGARPAFAVDNINVTAGGGTPSATINVAGAFSNFSTTQGTASTSQSINISGTNLTDNITATPSALYEISSDNTNFSPSVTLNQSGGTVTATPVFVRLAASAPAGAANGSLALTSAGASQQNISLTGTVNPVSVPAANVVINQVYGGGGNTGSLYKNDFIELYNNENTPVNLAGWSVQYTGATGGGTWQATPLTGIIPAHSFFLVQESAGASGTVNLPTPDVTGTILMGATGGKVILCNTTAAQTGENPAGVAIMDKVGYSPNATGFETAPFGIAPENATAVTRITDGVDNNNNATDFQIASPLPRNSTYTTTPPAIVSLRPPTGSANVPYNIFPSITFDKPVQKGTGNITIVENGVATPISIASSSIVISSNKLTASINVLLTGNKSYFIQIDAGAFEDVYGNDFAGINNNTTWAFTTYNATVPVAVPVTFDLDNCTGSGLLPNGFTQYSSTGAQVWDCTPFGRDPLAPGGTAPFGAGVQMNGFDNAAGSNVINTDWLISPSLDLTGTTFPLLSFYSRTRFNGQPLQLKVSTDYTGTGDPALATWIDLNGKFPAQTSDTWTLSSNINLSNYKQTNVHIAFVYSSTNDEGARWTLDDINIINSATPPPPSLSSSATDLDFLFTASASSSVKEFTVIGNDLTGDITLTATGNSFTLSKDNTSFASSILFTQAEANNVFKTVYVKFAPALSDKNYSDSISIGTTSVSDIKVYVKGTSIDPAKTLEVVNWNLEWFGTPDLTLGPPNKALQKQNVSTILQSTGADLYALVEVVDTAALGDIVRTSMPGYSYIICTYGSHGNPFENNPSPMSELQKEAFVYKTSVFSNIDTTALLSLGVNTAADLSNPDYNNWSSGRYPYMFSADVTLGAITKRIRFIAVHAKANTSPTVTSYNRRKAGADNLHAYLNSAYPTDNIVILGDLNDDLDSTITDGITPRLTSYSAFTNDNASFYSPTLAGLSLTGKKSTVKYNDVIDHVIVSNELQPFYMNNSASVLTDVTSLVSNYGSTTTDHYPIFTRFAFDGSILPIKVTDFTATKQNNVVKLGWKTSEEINSKEFIVERSADGSRFTAIGNVGARGVASAYTLTDANPAIGNNFYRLKLVDKDGKSDYSKIVKINFSRQLQVQVAPNPASTFINVSLQNNSSPARLEIVNLDGKLVRQQSLAPSQQYVPVVIAGLAKGLYTVKVISATEVATRKLVIQ